MTISANAAVDERRAAAHRRTCTRVAATAFAFALASSMQVHAQSADSLFQSTGESSSQPASGQSEGGGSSADSLFQSTQPASGESTSEPASKDALFSSQPAADTPKSILGVEINGFFQNELAYTYSDPDHWSKFKNTLDIYADGRASDVFTWRLGGRLSYDPIYDMTNFYPDQVRDDQTLEAQIREAYVDFSTGGFELRVGRQHIIWGEVLGGFVADIVSAKDFRENIVQDFDLLRIPQWAVNAEVFKGDFYGQLLWIPYTTVNDIGEAGSEFYPFAVQLPPGVNAVFRGDDKPSPALSNSGVGARVSYLSGGWDASLFYYTSIDQNAAFERSILPGATPSFVFRPIHERIHQVGTTVAKDFEDALFKVEAVYTMNRNYEVTSLADSDGLVEKDALDYILAAEWTFEHETTVILQFSQRWTRNHVSSMLFDDLESGFSVYASTKFLHDDIKPEVLWVQSLNRSDWLLEAKVNWEFAPNWRAVVGADIFGGPATGLFGRYDNNDRVYYEMRYSF